VEQVPTPESYGLLVPRKSEKGENHEQTRIIIIKYSKISFFVVIVYSASGAGLVCREKYTSLFCISLKNSHFHFSADECPPFVRSLWITADSVEF